MSKIQEALLRLQTSSPRQSPVKETSVDAVLPEPLADTGDSPLTKTIAPFATSNKILKIDMMKLREAGLIGPEQDSNILAVQFQQIKRPLIRHAFGKRSTKVEDGNLIMITSAFAGEGKTFISMNLALSMARERDHHVIFVDADVAKPHVSEVFGLAGEKGLLDFIEDDSLNVNSLIIPTNIDGLSVLPAGRPRPHATELLASSRMEQLTQALAAITHEPIVIFDSPPLLQTNEASVVSHVVGQIVVVVRADHTSHDAVRMAIGLIGSDRAVSVVLNQAPDGAMDYQYGYGHTSATPGHVPLPNEPHLRDVQTTRTG